MVRIGLWSSLLTLTIIGCRSEKVGRQDTAPAPAPPPLETPPTGTIAGEIRASGQPLADARVCVNRDVPILDRVREDIEPTCVRTSAAGRFEVQVGAGLYSVIAAADRHLPGGEQVVLRADEPGALVQLELLPGGREYVGRVVDLDHRPIAAATISHVVQLGTRRHRAVEVETDADGRYRFWSTRAGSLRVDAPGHGRQGIPERDGQQLVLVPEATIAGTVVDRDGQPVAHARVVTHDGGFGSPAWGWPDHAVHTDAEGRFTITQLLPDNHELLALSPDRELGGNETVHVALAERREDVVLTLDIDLHQYRVQVVDVASNAPVAACRAEWKVGDELFGAVVWGDERGRLEVPLASREFELAELACPGYVARKPFPEIEAGASEPTRIEVQRGLELHGTIVAAGRPQVGYPVALRPKDAESHYVIWPDEDTTDALGRFTIIGLPPGTYHLGERVREIVVDERRSQEVSIEVPSSGRIEVEVGPEHVGRQVYAHDCAEPHYDGPRPWWDVAQVEPSGLAVIERAPIGSYRVSIDPDADHCGDESVPIDVAAGETTKLRLAAEGERAAPPVRVRVTSPSGEPVAAAVVTVSPASEAITAREWTLKLLFHAAITDVQGRARVPTHGTRFNVVAVRPGQFAARTVDGEAATQELELRLQPHE